MQQLHYPSEVRPVSEVGLDDAPVDEAELELAIRLIQQGAVKTFRADTYADEIRGRIEALIARKVDGEDITELATQSPATQVIDLMAALKQSLAKDLDGDTRVSVEAGTAASGDREG